jgi:adenine-specific DNA-methyltransferase
MPDNYDNLTREQLIGLLRKRDLSRRLGLVWERDEIEHEKALTEDLPLVELDSGLSRGAGPWRDLLIEGDNFPALRFLRAAFKGRVKCIYIDPPYNTGNRDFVYNDRYLDPDDAFRHSTWLEFLYRRLSLARDLLRDDGVLLVSINDENRAYLELLLAQVWPGGRRGTMVWRSRIGDNSGKGANLSVNHEHVLVWAGEGFAFRGEEKTYSMYGNEDSDPRGDWTSSDLTQPKNWQERPNAFYPVHDPKNDIWYPPNPDRVWAYASENKLEEGQSTRKDTVEELIRQNRVVFPKDVQFSVWNTFEQLVAAIRAGDVPKDGTGGLMIREDIDLIPLEFWVGKKIGFGAPRFKRFKSELSDTTQPLSSWVKAASEKDFDSDSGAVHIESGFTDEGSKELRRLLGDKAFPYPKPPSLLRGLVDQSTEPGDVVLDFFAGSATTAQAVAQLNERDAQAALKAGSPPPEARRWIMVSSTEATADEPDKNICRDVAARRLSALSLDFAYLRVRHAPAAMDGRGLEESWIGPSLQLILSGRAGRDGAGSSVSWIEGDDILAGFVRRLTPALLDELEGMEVPAGKTAVIASFQPGPLRQRLGHRPDMRILPLPEVLVKALTGSVGLAGLARGAGNSGEALS